MEQLWGDVEGGLLKRKKISVASSKTGLKALGWDFIV